MRHFIRESRVWAFLLIVLILDFSRGAEPPDHGPAATLNEAQNAFKSRQYEKAIQLLSAHLESSPREAFLLLAQSYTAANNPMMALKTLSTAQAKYKNDREISTELGKAQFALNKEREAKATLKEVIDLNPTYEPAYLAIAEIYEKRKNRYELRLLYQDLVEKLGEKPAYLTKLCELSTREGLYDLAFKYCERGLALNNREPLNYINIATAFKETGQSSKANSFFKKAADAFPKSEEAQFAYSNFLDESKNFAQSYIYWKRSTEADPKSVRAWNGLAFASLEIQKFADTLRAFEKLCEVDKNAERQLRRAAGLLKPLNQPAWYDKLSNLISNCAGKSKASSFL